VVPDENGRGLLEEPPPPSPKSRRDLWLWLGLLALLVAAAVAAAVFLITAPTQASVPAVVGKPVKVATTTLKRAGFKVTVRRARSTRAAGVVLSQNPQSGSQANEGSTVRLTVSAGPGSVTVPHVAGKPLAQAEAILRQHRLKVGKVQYVHENSVPAGEVSSTSPFAGEPVRPGTAVTLFVSSGPATKTVPDVTGDAEATARATLESAGFSVASSTSTTNSAPAGTVITQSPAGNAQATPGSTVSIVVAVKPKPPPPPSATVPSVTGQSEAQAKSALRAAGLGVNVSTQTVTDKSKNGMVLSQSPSGGTKVKKGTSVTIVVGNYKQPTTPTTPTTTSTTPGGGKGGHGGGGGGGGGSSAGPARVR
jgi:serine/threonine-protein kinase